jgi:hypothetical protein
MPFSEEGLKGELEVVESATRVFMAALSYTVPVRWPPGVRGTLESTAR